MTIFDLELRHPHHQSEEETEYFADMTAQEVMSKFNGMNWKQLQILMLQMQGGKTALTVTDHELNHTVKVSLIELPNTNALAFNFESDIEIETEQKKLFGFLTYRSAVALEFQHLNLAATRNLLNAFTLQELDTLQKHYVQQHEEVSS